MKKLIEKNVIKINYHNFLNKYKTHTGYERDATDNELYEHFIVNPLTYSRPRGCLPEGFSRWKELQQLDGLNIFEIVDYVNVGERLYKFDEEGGGEDDEVQDSPNGSEDCGDSPYDDPSDDSKIGQFNKLKKKKNERNDKKKTANRMNKNYLSNKGNSEKRRIFRFLLFDGHNFIYAYEKEYNENFNYLEKYTYRYPKIILYNKPSIQRGTLLLKKNQVTILFKGCKVSETGSPPLEDDQLDEVTSTTGTPFHAENIPNYQVSIRKRENHNIINLTDGPKNYAYKEDRIRMREEIQYRENQNDDTPRKFYYVEDTAKNDFQFKSTYLNRMNHPNVEDRSKSNICNRINQHSQDALGKEYTNSKWEHTWKGRTYEHSVETEHKQGAGNNPNEHYNRNRTWSHLQGLEKADGENFNTGHGNYWEKHQSEHNTGMHAMQSRNDYNRERIHFYNRDKYRQYPTNGYDNYEKNCSEDYPRLSEYNDKNDERIHWSKEAKNKHVSNELKDTGYQRLSGAVGGDWSDQLNHGSNRNEGDNSQFSSQYGNFGNMAHYPMDTNDWEKKNVLTAHARGEGENWMMGSRFTETHSTSRENQMGETLQNVERTHFEVKDPVEKNIVGLKSGEIFNEKDQHCDAINKKKGNELIDLTEGFFQSDFFHNTNELDSVNKGSEVIILDE
ncbi:conserved Plasmodium protein, unknown function [Plasmodium knowlesi strain H]|uniref:RecQ mediated genome instability protein 1 OB-fold domain-containing protein n=3 Tax=Plasmodium knowlesi TaxID=5850 RepID=A0A5K1ULJ1_PLAKH|nr:conserved Plasmodium protein, unknown function [Plasmodium knowlesi strain H]OTN65801.1 Uncharacterized protein PKNOH_S100043500 [Plasmodium knowlesi]CAA9987798.1 conserved Plasmodium protein, unknown function [Plasmodium knowlesi strain H]SBO22420.1 conserved Plasmodium protein, unknown function [Plasmodium knowlesi strain H]SBO29531.1 conserved Plasmodium protein, unknown function [Plasmodium knowlesi strain H]VVS77272.1 conserved Plasmodium protein, unknown function [Plasmodium knowlesi |eukprot:XP_002258795.1 hypothetical protein, conserved in Plasmodium species [Plasmodium knowlesi strain H]